MAKKKTKAIRTAKTARTADIEGLVDLTDEEKQKLPKPKEGFDRHVGPMLDLYRRHFDALKSRGANADTIEARFRAWQTLVPVEASAAKHLEVVQESRLLHASKVWSALLEIYAKAQAEARTNREVASAIEDFRKFMATGPRKKSTNRTIPPTP